MRNKFKSAPALLSILSLLLLMSAANVDDPTGPELSSSGERLDGRHDSYGTLKSAQIVPNVDSPKIFSSDPSNMAVGNPSDEKTLSFESQNCTLKNDVLQQLRLSNESEWRINQTGLSLLRNDPQQLINCTDPGDRVIFELTGAYKFNRTLAVDRELEFISRSPETNKSNDDSKSVASFTCPDSVPFLTIQSANFTASGFFVENCTQKDINGTVVLDSNSEVDFNNFGFSNNKARAVYADDNVKLTLKSCRFKNNTLSTGNGAAIYFPNNCTVTIVHSSFSSNVVSSGNGGGMYGNTSNTLSIKHSTFSGNNATKKGGAAYMFKQNNVTVEESGFFENNGDVGGALRFYGANNVTIKASNFSNNRATRSAAAMAFRRNNIVTVEYTEFSRNIAAGAAVMLFSIRNSVTVISCSLKENNGTKYGGALSVNVFSTANITDSSFEGNEARWGGAVYAECDAIVSISDTRFLNNTAREGGAIAVWTNCYISIRNSTIEQNNATNGGCLYVDSSKIEVDASNFTENKSQKLGGCFSADSSSITVTNSTLLKNEAKEGGGIHVSTRTFLNMTNTTIRSNWGNNSAGGLALMDNSKLLCSLCKFEENTAGRGGGLYIKSQTKQIVVARLQNSVFNGNNASMYGGGMLVETVGTRAINCSEDLASCSKVLLFKTHFINNNANVSGSAILATTPQNVLIACNETIDHTSPVFVSEDIFEVIQTDKVKQLKPNDTCSSWQNNSLTHNAFGDVIGTFGHSLVLTIVASNGLNITGDYTSGYVLSNVESAKQFPNITVITEDAFGNKPAPVMFEDDALQLVSENGFLKNDITFSFENMRCVVSSVSASAPKGTYMIMIIPKDGDVLEPTTLNISISDCGINEELLDTKVCQECRSGLYNFNAYKQEHCETCPTHADCDGIFLLVKEGYWQRSPCHHKVKKCIVKQACKYPNRTDYITTFTQNFIDCNFTKTNLEYYGKLQCRKGYKGPLCGSCKKSFGCSANLQCVKCGPMWYSVLRILFISLWLFVTTTITIKGTLPIASRCLARTVAMTPLLEDVNSIPSEEGTSTQIEEMPQEGSNAPQVTTNDEQQVSSDASSQLAYDIKIATDTLIETWKTLLNFLQVISSAATMDLKWTNKILSFFKTLNVLGSATLNAISGPIDCVVASCSFKVRIILMYVIRMFVPILVIAILSFYWGYHFFVRYRAEGWYFWRRFLLTTITVIYITYFDIAQVAVRAFNCIVVYDNIDPFSNSAKKYWVGNTSIECYEGTHVVLVVTSVVSTIVSIGFPLVCARALLKNRNEVNVGNSRAHEILGLLCGPFKDQFVYWECIVMIKKASLAIIMVFSHTLSGQEQGLLISIVIVFFLALHSICFPYKKEFSILNYYEIGSLMTSSITYILVQFLSDETPGIEEILVFVVLVILIGGFILLMALNIARSLIAVAKVSLKSYGIIGINDEINWFETIKLYSASWWFRRLSSTWN